MDGYEVSLQSRMDPTPHSARAERRARAAQARMIFAEGMTPRVAPLLNINDRVWARPWLWAVPPMSKLA